MVRIFIEFGIQSFYDLVLWIEVEAEILWRHVASNIPEGGRGPLSAEELPANQL